MSDLPVDGRLRPVRDDDSAALINLIGTAYAEYPGCVLDLDGVDADLVEPGSTFAARDGEMMVVDTDRHGIVACVGWVPVTDGSVELKRLYVAPAVRRQGLATWLVRWVEQRAVEHDAHTVQLWSDTRFEDAHRLYEHLGYERQDEERELHDPSNTVEARYRRHLEV